MKNEAQLLDQEATAELLGISSRTLQSWRRRKVGPSVIVMPGGAIIRYARRRDGVGEETDPHDRSGVIEMSTERQDARRDLIRSLLDKNRASDASHQQKADIELLAS
jgi:hypothetical protein